MRTGYNASVLIQKKKNRVVGISLGADFCAEHEWGIKGIKQDFGIDDTLIGLDKRLIRSVPNLFEWVDEAKSVQGFWLHRSYCKFPPNSMSFSGYRSSYDKKEPHWRGWTAWDEGSFAAFSHDLNDHKSLREIFDAVKSLDAAIWLGGGGVFENAGLVIAVASRLNHDVIANWKKVDEERIKITEEVKKLGIEEDLKKAGKRYFALSPSYDAKGKLMFWLNPMEQHLYNSRWCSVDELRQWIQDKGPIMKSVQERRRA